MSEGKLQVKAFPVRKLEQGVPRFIGYFPFLVNEKGTVRGHAISPYDADGTLYGTVYKTPEAALRAYTYHLALEVSREATRRLVADQQDSSESPSRN